MHIMGTEHKHTTAYHTKQMGLLNDLTKSKKNTIASYSQECRNGWDAKLGEIVYAYNTSVQESTKHTPFEAMFGRVARLPVDCNTDFLKNAKQKLEKDKHARSPELKERAMKRQKWRHQLKKTLKLLNKSRRSTRIMNMLHLLVLMWEFWKDEGLQQMKSKGGCLDFYWQGPYIYIFCLKEMNAKGYTNVMLIHFHQTILRI